jgi:hypothetical protein
MRFDLSNTASLLERTPGVLRSLFDGLAPAWTEGTEGPGTWSPLETLAHLTTVERSHWIPRAMIIRGDAPERRLPVLNATTSLHETAGLGIPALLGTFERLRVENLATLSAWNLTDEALARTGQHPEFGSVTLGQLLATWTAHDLTHLGQITRVMAKQYREEVGPWRAYLRVMKS